MDLTFEEFQVLHMGYQQRENTEERYILGHES